jgi:hypothetical protein
LVGQHFVSSAQTPVRYVRWAAGAAVRSGPELAQDVAEIIAAAQRSSLNILLQNVMDHIGMTFNQQCNLGMVVGHRKIFEPADQPNYYNDHRQDSKLFEKKFESSRRPIRLRAPSDSAIAES